MSSFLNFLNNFFFLIFFQIKIIFFSLIFVGFIAVKAGSTLELFHAYRTLWDRTEGL